MNSNIDRKYKLIFERPGFKSDKIMYAEGETVTVYFGMIATDTDYQFLVDAEGVKQSYDSGKGIVLSFDMPAHDVTLTIKSRNTMERDPNLIKKPEPENRPGKTDTVSDLLEGEWICPECGQKNAGKYCMECGHRRPN